MADCKRSSQRRGLRSACAETRDIVLCIMRYAKLLPIVWLTLMSIASRGVSITNAEGNDVDIQVKEAWIRWLPANLPGAGYMTLTNVGRSAHVLVGAASPDYADVSMHRTYIDNGMSKMEPADSIVLKPHATVRFAEGGFHLMLMQPTRIIKAGDRVTVVLRFAVGGEIRVPFEVRAGR